MSFYRERIYPHLVTLLGNPKPIAQIRQRIVPFLEIGVGPGVNFPHYDPAKVQNVYALEATSELLPWRRKICAIGFRYDRRREGGSLLVPRPR
jgi:hypothetical protein